MPRARAAGLEPTHLTTHLGALFERPDFIDAYLRVAQQEWIPAAVVELTDEQLDALAQAGAAVPDDVVQALDDFPLPKLDALRFVPDTESYESKKQALLTLIAEAPPGLTQIELRPATASDALPRIVDDAQRRLGRAIADRRRRAAGVTGRRRRDDALARDHATVRRRRPGRRGACDCDDRPT